ncbi:hypothetical protein ACWC2K_20610 [Streptomyces chattanoogensis]|uniref:hypothetical protein n=1 Tax=Streptomyces chattanoogensis TaxID=66876 RepID=UPI0036AE3472
MDNDVTCEQLREIGAELALGVLPGRQRAEAVRHLDRCADCREYVEQLTLVGDGLLGLLPGSEPPAGFETRVARRLQHAAAQDDRGRLRGRGALPRRGFRSRVRLRVAAAAATLALAFGFGGWAVGTILSNEAAAPSRPVEAGAGMLHAQLAAVGHERGPVGEIYVHPGPPAWVYMSVDLADAGIPYGGKASCVLVRKDGTSVRIGTFTLHGGYGYWGAPSSVDPSKLSGVRLTAADGTVLATARFGAR